MPAQCDDAAVAVPCGGAVIDARAVLGVDIVKPQDGRLFAADLLDVVELIARAAVPVP